MVLFHPEKVNRLILYGASCGGKENVPQAPQVVKILSDLVNNRTQDPEKILSITFPLNWVNSHPNVSFSKSTEIVTSNILYNSLISMKPGLRRTGVVFVVSSQESPDLPWS
jgi:hypothetical protein